MTTVARAPSIAQRPFALALVELGRSRTEVVCITNDLTASSEADDFREAFPERFFSLGMAEQNLIGVAAGLAREGWEPFYPTFGVFATRRPYEQIALQVAYPALPVRLCGFLPGLLTPGGPTHQATDDIALMSQLPNMTVLDLADATDIEGALTAMAGIPGPVYCRVLRGAVPRRFVDGFSLGRSRSLADGHDLLVISSGIAVDAAEEATKRIRAAGVDAGHRHVTTLKPFDDEDLLRDIEVARWGVITLENHLVRGGLGTAVAEAMAERGVSSRLRRIGVRDTFTHGGSTAYLQTYYGLAADDVVRVAGSLVGDPRLADLTAALGDLASDEPVRGSGDGWRQSEAL